MTFPLPPEAVTVEELTHGTALVTAQGTTVALDPATGRSYATSAPLFIAPFPCEITWLSIAVQRAGAGDVLAPLSDTAFWDIQLRRFRGGNPAAVTVARKTTRVTAGGGYPAGQAIRYRTPWTFDAALFDPAARMLQAGDLLDLAFLPTPNMAVNPPGLGQPVYAQLRYQPA